MLEQKKFLWIDWIFFSLYTLVFVFELYMLIFQPAELHLHTASGKLLMFAVFAAAYAVPLWFWRPGSIKAVYFTIAAFALHGGVSAYYAVTLGQMVSILAPITLISAYLLGSRGPWVLLALYPVVHPILYFFVIEDYDTLYYTNEVAGTLLVFGIGFGANKMQYSNQVLKRLLKENEEQTKIIKERSLVLEQYSQKVEQLTILEERDRVARELHDTVGHTFTSVIMGLDAVTLLLEKDPEKAKAKLAVLRSLTHNGLEEVRKTIHQTASEEEKLPISQQLSRLAGEFAVHTGTQIRFQLEGEETALPKQTMLTLIRCLQESLTNAKRHGRARVVDITFSFRPNQVVLRVEDDGVGAESPTLGFGLTAMRERVSALQGHIDFRTGPGEGAVVLCSIPLRGYDHESRTSAAR
ncbi:sensor histidine kinase [Paenibacillus thermotolerans]|uniref:sensor histidine kinase n=1 Tax=Paenibacillus thermotolerans TaxID=3027807 RepID=UPI0023688306|nr:MULTISPECIES: sensor histidine kinase [unclassified Paenibacillus]